MLSLLRPRSLNQSLGWLLAAVVMPLLLGVLGLLALQARQERSATQAQLSAVAQSVMQVADAELERGRAQVEVLAASPMVDQADWKAMHAYAQVVTSRVPGSVIVLVGPDGQVLFNTAAPWGQKLPNLWALGNENREVRWQGRSLPLSSGNLSRQAFESRQPVYSDLYYGVQIQRPALSVSIPVLRGGQSRYAMIFSYPPALLQERVGSAVRVPGIRAVLIDRRGRVVAANQEAASRLGDPIMSIDIPPGSVAGIYRNRARDGVAILGAYAVSPLNGFTVRAGLADEDHWWLSARATPLAWAALLLVAMLVSVLLASLVSRKLAQPLQALGEDVRAGRAPPPERDTGIAEFDLLAQALRDGAEAEQERAREQTLRTVAQNQEALLRQADRQKDEFLATLAHELRNPLAPIRTAAELIRRQAPADPVIERARAIIERQSLHLTRLVDDLLDVSRITLGRIHLRQETVDFGEVAASAAESMQQAAAARRLVLDTAIARPAPLVRGDATRLAQCVVNLLNNAVKFTPEGGQVTLRVAVEGDRAVAEVRDTGVGIRPENLARVFELFVQERHSGHHGNTGLGIGLALTRRLVELHGGTIRADSAGLGQGSTFRIELPLDASPQQPAPVPVPADAPPGGEAEVPAGASTLVLVVDDNRDAAETLGEMLGLSGYAVRLAHDGLSALRVVAEHRPQVVLLDIGLPDIDGYEVCRRIRARGGSAPPVLIALTGWGQRSDQEAAQQAGFQAHVTKPVEADALLQLLARFARG